MKIRFNIILPFKSTYYYCSCSFSVPHQNAVPTSPLPAHAMCPTHLILVDLISRIFYVQYVVLCIGQYNSTCLLTNTQPYDVIYE